MVASFRFWGAPNFGPRFLDGIFGWISVSFDIPRCFSVKKWATYMVTWWPIPNWWKPCLSAWVLPCGAHGHRLPEIGSAGNSYQLLEGLQLPETSSFLKTGNFQLSVFICFYMFFLIFLQLSNTSKVVISKAWIPMELPVELPMELPMDSCVPKVCRTPLGPLHVRWDAQKWR